MSLTVASVVFKSLVTRGVFAKVGDTIEAWRARKVERAFQLLVASLVELDPLPEAAQSERLERILLAGEPGTGDPHQALYEAFRSFAFTRTEAAWPYIALMTADYVHHNRPVDKFFRRMGWLLERCEEEDIEVLRAAARATSAKLSEPPDFPNLLVTWKCVTTSAEMEVDVVNADEGVGSSLMGNGGAGDTAADAVRALLAESRLARAKGALKVAFLVGDDDQMIGRLVKLFRR